MSQQRTSSHPMLVKLLENLVDRIGVDESGTYNRQDPTHYEKGTATFDVHGKMLRIHFNDCTWGVEIEICMLKHVPFDRLPANIWEDDETLTAWKKSKHGTQFKMDERGITYLSPLLSNYYLTGDWGPRNQVIIRKQAKGILKLLYQLVQKYPSVRPTWEELMEMEEDPMGSLSDYE